MFDLIESLYFLTEHGNPGNIPAFYSAKLNSYSKANLQRPPLRANGTEYSGKLENVANTKSWLYGMYMLEIHVTNPQSQTPCTTGKVLTTALHPSLVCSM